MGREQNDEYHRYSDFGEKSKKILPKRKNFKKFTKWELISLDLGLLWSCNHSIYDYGNFGFWGAYLDPGKIITSMNVSRFTMTNEERNLIKGNLSNVHFINAVQ